MSTQTCFDMSLTGLSAFEKLVTFVREEPKHTVLSIIITSMYKQQSFHPSIVNLSLGFETPSKFIYHYLSRMNGQVNSSIFQLER